MLFMELMSYTFLLAFWVVLFCAFDELMLKGYFRKKLHKRLGIDK